MYEIKSAQARWTRRTPKPERPSRATNSLPQFRNKVPIEEECATSVLMCFDQGGCCLRCINSMLVAIQKGISFDWLRRAICPITYIKKDLDESFCDHAFAGRVSCTFLRYVASHLGDQYALAIKQRLSALLILLLLLHAACTLKRCVRLAPTMCQAPHI